MGESKDATNPKEKKPRWVGDQLGFRSVHSRIKLEFLVAFWGFDGTSGWRGEEDEGKGVEISAAQHRPERPKRPHASNCAHVDLVR